LTITNLMLEKILINIIKEKRNKTKQNETF